MAIEIVDFPIKNGDFPVRYVSLPEGKMAVFFPGKCCRKPDSDVPAAVRSLTISRQKPSQLTSRLDMFLSNCREPVLFYWENLGCLGYSELLLYNYMDTQ